MLRTEPTVNVPVRGPCPPPTMPVFYPVSSSAPIDITLRGGRIETRGVTRPYLGLPPLAAPPLPPGAGGRDVPLVEGAGLPIALPRSFFMSFVCDPGIGPDLFCSAIGFRSFHFLPVLLSLALPSLLVLPPEPLLVSFGVPAVSIVPLPPGLGGRSASFNDSNLPRLRAFACPALISGHQLICTSFALLARTSGWRTAARFGWSDAGLTWLPSGTKVFFGRRRRGRLQFHLTRS